MKDTGRDTDKKQWNEYCPTINGIKNAIPANAKWFATEDISDAYEGAEVTADSRHFLTAAPPVPIRASMFTDEELTKSYGGRTQSKSYGKLGTYWSNGLGCPRDWQSVPRSSTVTWQMG